jgi:hypothetical protein
MEVLHHFGGIFGIKNSQIQTERGLEGEH